MSKKFIKLSFQNAKWFPKNSRTKDFLGTLDSTNKGGLYFKRTKRAEVENGNFVEAITVHHISNMLHTLIGERPVPSFRKTFYSRDEHVFNLANESYLKIDTPKVTKKVKDEIYEVYVDELIRVNKSADDSWLNPQSVQWFKVKKMMGVHFDDFIRMMNDALGYNVLSEPFERVLNIYNKYGSKLDNILSFLKEKRKMPISNFLTRNTLNRSEITSHTLLGETIISGIDRVHILSGEILVPYNEGFVNRIIKNTTNILDGGYVKIIGLFYEDEIYNVNDFIPVSEITDKKH